MKKSKNQKSKKLSIFIISALLSGCSVYFSPINIEQLNFNLTVQNINI